MNSPQVARILLVDDEPENLKAIDRTLRGKFAVTLVTDPNMARKEIEVNPYEVIVSDQRMPGMLGTELLAQVAKIRPLVTRVILTAYTDTKELLDAINRAEIYRYVTKPWDNQELIAVLNQAVTHHRLLTENQKLIRDLGEANQSLRKKEQELIQLNKNLEGMVQQRTAELTIANRQLSELAMTDPLTKLFNRRSFFQKFNEEVERSKRYQHNIVAVMIDVDHFKKFNDMEGHVYGDEALKKIAQTLAANLRKTDCIARYGGEEFVIMMTETSVAQAIPICQRLRTSIENLTFQGQKQSAWLTVSMGLSGYPDEGDTAEQLIVVADANLYEAKNLGRNRVHHPTIKQNASFFFR